MPTRHQNALRAGRGAIPVGVEGSRLVRLKSCRWTSPEAKRTVRNGRAKALFFFFGYKGSLREQIKNKGQKQRRSTKMRKRED